MTIERERGLDPPATHDAEAHGVHTAEILVGKLPQQALRGQRS